MPFQFHRLRVFIFGLLLLFVSVSGGSPLVSQEETPPVEPPPTETVAEPLPTETLTETPTLTATFTETPTLMPAFTETPPEEPSPTPALETPTETPTETELFPEDTATVIATLEPSIYETAEFLPLPTPEGVVPRGGAAPQGPPAPSLFNVVSIPDGDIALLRTTVASACGGGSPVTVELAANGTYTFTNAPFNLFYPTALLICGDVTILGNNATLERSTATGIPRFRLIGVEDTGTLYLENATLRDAEIDANGGAALVVVGGAAFLDNVNILDNKAVAGSSPFLTSGAAVYNYFGFMEFTDVEISGSQSDSDLGGSAVTSWGGTFIMENSRIINNTSVQNGGGLFIRTPSVMELRFNEISGNVAPDAAALDFEGTPTLDTFMNYNCIYDNNMTANPQSAVRSNQSLLNAGWNWWDDNVSVNNNVDADPEIMNQPLDCTSETDWQPLICPSGFTLLVEEECPPTLADFGIILEGDPEHWSLFERTAILQAAIETGTALYAHGVGSTPVEAFREVMQGMNFGQWRKIRFYRSGLPGNYCDTTSLPTGEYSAGIACHPDLNMTQYTAVHEFGHVFVGRTGGEVSGTNTFYGLVESPGGPGTPLFSSGAFVMGPRSVPIQGRSLIDWQRSHFVLDNGWGSAAQWDQESDYEYPVPDLPTVTPSGPIATGYPVRIPAIGPCGPGAPNDLPPVFGTPFPMQQNPCTFSDEFASNGEGLITERVEAAAEMFLNWVYWKNYGPPPLVPTGTPTPSGFGDIRWRYASLGGGGCYPSGCDDPDDSGQARQTWMDNTMSNLFTEYGW